MSLLQRWLEDPVRCARIQRGFYIGLALVVLAEILLPRLFHGGHGHFAFEDWPAWGSVYGFLSCAAIILVSKLLGKAWLMRREDYYDD